MAQELVSFGDIVPDQLRVKPIVTGAGRVARRTKREFLPVNSTDDYKPDGSSEIQFNISASKEMLIMNECYLRFRLAVQGTVGGVNDYGVTFSEMGAHGLFRRIEVSDRANRVIDTIEGYDHVSKVVSSVYEDKNYSNYDEFGSGMYHSTQSNKLVPFEANFNSANVQISYDEFSVGDVAINAGAFQLNGTGTAFSAKLVGRKCIVYPGGSSIYVPMVSRVTAYTNATTITIADPWPYANATGLKFAVLDEPGRIGYQDTDEYKEYTIRLKLGMFDMKEDLPLFLMDGLQIKLFLNGKTIPFRMSPLTGTKTITYLIKDPRFVCHTRTPSAEIRDQYLEMFDKGMLNYAFKTFHAQVRPISGQINGRVELNFAISKSSIKKVFFVMMTNVERGEQNSSFLFSDSFVADSYRYSNLALEEFQFKIGAADYPNSPVRITDELAAEAFAELLVTVGRHRNDMKSMRLNYSDWAANGQGYTQTSSGEYRSEPYTRIYGTSFDTINDDLLSGVKTRGLGSDDNVVLILNFKTTGNNEVRIERNPGVTTVSPRYVWAIFEHGRVLHISRTGIMVLD